ncbi:MAG: hypothetical protein R2932_03020 [Caldilineaceae bacterium]
MIGDDVESDVRGTAYRHAGLAGETGRFRKEDLQRGIWPDKVFESIAEIVT